MKHFKMSLPPCGIRMDRILFLKGPLGEANGDRGRRAAFRVAFFRSLESLPAPCTRLVTIREKWAHLDSNQRPRPYQGRALTN